MGALFRILYLAKMSGGQFRIHTRKFMTNRLLQRKQMVVDVLHPNMAGVSKADITKELAKRYKADEKAIMMFGFKSAFGGGKSSGFALIYDDAEALKRFEMKYRQARVGVFEHSRKSRKMLKETKNRMKKLRGKELTVAKSKAD